MKLEKQLASMEADLEQIQKYVLYSTKVKKQLSYMGMRTTDIENMYLEPEDLFVGPSGETNLDRATSFNQ